MTTLKDLIALCGKDQGKVFIADETGNISLVVLGIEEYKQLKLDRLKEKVVSAEKVNREITRAQLQEADVWEPAITEAPKPLFPNTVQSRMTHDSLSGGVPKVDMRSEVIDPTFDFEAPKIEIEDI